jgi:DNA-binding NtrC family response regulator
MRADEPGPTRGRILLIDDDRVFGIWAAQVLCKRGGHELKHVLDPAAGLLCVQTEPWDLVITDIEMPGMTGIELLQRVHLIEPALPVAVVTAHAAADRAVSALRSSAVEFFHKPMAADEFLGKIAELIAGGRAVTSPRGVHGADGDARGVDAVDPDEGAGVGGVDHLAVADVDPDVVNGAGV